MQPKPTVEDVKVDSVTYITAAHLKESDFPNYTRVWYDTKTDRAVYVKNDYKPSTSVEVGATVSFGESAGTVVSCDEQGFTIKLSTGFAKYGMSGSYVYYKDVPIAFVSMAMDVDKVYAVFF